MSPARKATRSFSGTGLGLAVEARELLRPPALGHPHPTSRLPSQAPGCHSAGCATSTRPRRRELPRRRRSRQRGGSTRAGRSHRGSAERRALRDPKGCWAARRRTVHDLALRPAPCAIRLRMNAFICWGRPARFRTRRAAYVDQGRRESASSSPMSGAARSRAPARRARAARARAPRRRLRRRTRGGRALPAAAFLPEQEPHVESACRIALSRPTVVAGPTMWGGTTRPRRSTKKLSG